MCDMDLRKTFVNPLICDMLQLLPGNVPCLMESLVCCSGRKAKMQNATHAHNDTRSQSFSLEKIALHHHHGRAAASNRACMNYTG